jgi:hypothetical protein
MSELVIRLDDQLASRLSEVVSEHYNGDQNSAVADALLFFFLQPIRKDRRRLARLIYEMREQVQAAGGVAEKDIARLIKEYRRGQRAPS